MQKRTFQLVRYLLNVGRVTIERRPSPPCRLLKFARPNLCKVSPTPGNFQQFIPKGRGLMLMQKLKVLWAPWLCKLTVTLPTALQAKMWACMHHSNMIHTWKDASFCGEKDGSLDTHASLKIALSYPRICRRCPVEFRACVAVVPDMEAKWGTLLYSDHIISAPNYISYVEVNFWDFKLGPKRSGAQGNLYLRKKEHCPNRKSGAE